MLRPFFAWIAPALIAATFERTTQLARVSNVENLRKHFKSPNPALNIPRRNEDVATDTLFADVPAIDGGDLMAQVYYGMKSHVLDAEGMGKESEFVNTLEDQIRNRGAMDRLLSDMAQAETSERVKDILRAYIIGDWQSEAHHQHQNPVERKIQTLKLTSTY